MPFNSFVDKTDTSHNPVRLMLKTKPPGPFRVLYAFDPTRTPLLLLGGDKTGDDRWYDKMVPKADAIYADHLKGL